MTVTSQEDNDLPSESDLRARLIALMGGRAAEELLFHEVTPGAANDFEKATQIATLMVHRWGMGHDPREATVDATGVPAAARCRSSPRRRTARCRPRSRQRPRARSPRSSTTPTRAARQTLLDNIDKLRTIGVYLVAQERIDGDTFDALFDGRIEVPDAETEWRPAAARPREWAAITAMAISSETPPDDTPGTAAG